MSELDQQILSQAPLGNRAQGPVSLRQYKLVPCILAGKLEFLIYLEALSHRDLREIFARKHMSA